MSKTKEEIEKLANKLFPEHEDIFEDIRNTNMRYGFIQGFEYGTKHLTEQLAEKEKEIENLQIQPSNSEIELWEKEEHLRALKISFIEILKRITYTKEEKEKYFEVECDCGFKGLSFLLLGGGQIADTGDYGDTYCPCCNSVIN